MHITTMRCQSIHMTSNILNTQTQHRRLSHNNNKKDTHEQYRRTTDNKQALFIKDSNKWFIVIHEFKIMIPHIPSSFDVFYELSRSASGDSIIR